jgi:ribose transport system permease protein
MPDLKIKMPRGRFGREGTPATAGVPAPAAEAAPTERVLTFGDVFGRDAGGLIVLLVLFGAMTMA